MKHKRWIGISLFIMIAIIITVSLFPIQLMAAGEADNEYYDQAIVLDDYGIKKVENQEGLNATEQMLEIEFISGPFKGKTMEIINSHSGAKGLDIDATKGDKVVICYNVDPQNTGEIEQAYVADNVRSGYLKILAAIFVFLIILIGVRQGIKALLALGLTILCLYKVMLPALMQGYSPLFVTVLSLSVVTLLTMLMIAGFTRKAMAATLGTIGGVVFAGVLAYLGGDLASLNGLSTEEERMLLYIENMTIDTRGLLFSGILIGAIGAIMDVAMSVASALEEIKKANPDLNQWQLVRAAMRVGNDIMGTMANTLILAYVGGSLPILILFAAYHYPSVRIINSELIATEIVRALAGSIGIIISVPLTALIGGLLHHDQNREIDYGYSPNRKNSRM